MKEIKGVGGSTFATELEIDDIKVGEQYLGNMQIYPKSLQGSILTVTSKNSNTVVVQEELVSSDNVEVSSDKVEVYPFMLEAV